MANTYPPDWAHIAKAVKDAAGWKCIRCAASHSRIDWRILTVHHMDGDKSNCKWWNLLALDQVCHLTIQGRVNPDIPYFLEHSEWIKPYVAGFYAWKYLEEHLTRPQVEVRLSELLSLEQLA